MPIVQNAYPVRQDSYILGQAMNSHYRTDTVVLEATGIGVAQPIAQGASDFGAVLMTAGATLLGITRLDQGRAVMDGATFLKGAPIAYFITGDVIVMSDAAVAPRGAVYWNPATGRYSTSNAAGNIAMTGWVVLTTATAAGQLFGIGKGRS